jgi:hypothetical protein
MKIWTYAEMLSKIENDCDLEDETFISSDEMAGYFNEGLNEAESEIIELNQDYLLTKSFVPVVAGQIRYELPFNIYANKIRALIYASGDMRYEVRRFRRKDKFVEISITDFDPPIDDYAYLLVNDVPGQAVMEIHPASLVSAILFPVSSIFSPFTLHYIRNCARVPMIGEFCNPEVIAAAQVTLSGSLIQTAAGTQKSTVAFGIAQQGRPGPYPGSIAYVTGDKVTLVPGPGSTLPSGFVEGVSYYVIALGAGSIALASTKALAMSGTRISIANVGTGYFTLTIAATTAIRMATIIDIPEFSTFVIQWVKCRCFEKESDPRLSGAAETLVQQKKQMVDTLTVSIEDDDDVIQGDFSHYDEMS